MDEEEQTKEVYAHAGLALYWAQCFEMSLANFLLILKGLDTDQISESEFNSYETQLQKQTLGRILKTIKQFVGFDEDSLVILNAALDRRNFIAHHFFRERTEFFLSSGGRNLMIEELIEIQKIFRKADAVGSALAGAAGKAAGITDEMIEKEFETLKEKHALS